VLIRGSLVSDAVIMIPPRIGQRVDVARGQQRAGERAARLGTTC
jgi:hypothetical protein